MSFEFEEKIEEPKDYTKRVWIAIAALFVLAVVCMVFFTNKREPNASVVTIRHILVKCPLDNPEEISRASRYRRWLSSVFFRVEFHSLPGMQPAGIRLASRQPPQSSRQEARSHGPSMRMLRQDAL